MSVAIIGGTGFGEAFSLDEPQTVETAYGPARLARGPDFIFLARHGAGHSVPPHRIAHRANIAALQSWGVTRVFATAAVGSLRLPLAPGDFVVLDDFLDLTKGDVVTFFDAPGSVRHTDMSRPYDPALRAVLLQTAGDDLGATVHPRSTYVCLSGPRYETPAEIRLLTSWGGDVVGMTSTPEAILCREAGIAYAAVAIVTNYGCGLTGDDAPLSHADVEAQMAQSRAALRGWLERAARAAG